MAEELSILEDDIKVCLFNTLCIEQLLDLVSPAQDQAADVRETGDIARASLEFKGWEAIVLNSIARLVREVRCVGRFLQFVRLFVHERRVQLRDTVNPNLLGRSTNLKRVAIPENDIYKMRASLNQT